MIKEDGGALPFQLKRRMRRLRHHPGIRRLIQEARLSVEDLVCPLFVHYGRGVRNPIQSMPGQYQLSIDQLSEEIKTIVSLNIPAVLLFGIPEKKDALGSIALDEQGIIQEAVRLIKKEAPGLLVMTDLCFCEYTDHGHCGVIENQEVDNDKTLLQLAEQAVSHAKAGADVIAPSGMMDGMVGFIRQALDQSGFSHLPILSYTVKYASSLYGPFREAAQGVPSFGDRKTHQMNPANGSEALAEASLDVAEGADMLMVKPAHTYLDIIYRLKQACPDLPLGAYHVSGEFSMIKAASEKGWLDETLVAMEILLSIKRAGADFIVTYFAKQIAACL